MNFEPGANHRKNMASKDQLITPSSGNTDTNDHRQYNESKDDHNFKPFYPGKRNSVMPSELEEGGMEPVTSLPLSVRKAMSYPKAEDRTPLVDKSMSKSFVDAEDAQKNDNYPNTDNDDQLNTLENDEDIIPEDEKWKERK